MTLKNHFMEALRLFEIHIVFSLASFVFSKSFYWFLSPGADIIISRAVIYSSITALLYLMALYSVMWNAGKSDRTEGSKPYILKGFVITLIASIPAIVLFLLNIHYTGGKIAASYRFYQFTYFGFMAIGSGNLLSCGLLMIPDLVIGTIGYIMGLKKVDITNDYISKIVFKKKSE